VRDYIVKSVSDTLDSAEISYVKWDMNRHSTALGAKAYDYILGLYDVLGRIFGPRPEILLENCASGGNRFDLGVLCYGPQTWASDDTDPVERLDIQTGYSYLYPQSTMGAHVSASPHVQTLRPTPLSTRGNVSFFGVLGYELDLKFLSPLDEKDIKDQIAYYKRHRALFQFGRFLRLPAPEGETRWQVSTGRDEAAVGIFYRITHAAPPLDELRAVGIDPEGRYTVKARHQNLRVGDFGELVRYVAPVRLHPKGLIMNAADSYYTMSDCKETLEASGAAIMSGLRLNNRFEGTGYNEEIRMQTDFGSAIYRVERIDTPELPAHEAEE
jgi:alpha-galactosidase